MRSVQNMNMHTSSSFSGLPFKPPFGSCLSANHQHNVSWSTSSSLSKIANEPTQTYTAICNCIIIHRTSKFKLIYLVRRDSLRPHEPQIHHRSFCIAGYTRRSSLHPTLKGARGETMHSQRRRENAYQFLRKSRQQIRQMAAVRIG